MLHHDNLDLSDLPGEEWKPVKGLEGSYFVSNLGRIKSLERTVRNRHSTRNIKAQIKKQTLTREGNLMVSFSSDQGESFRMVHSVVAESFLEQPKGSEKVQHIDGNKLNNALANLRYATLSKIFSAASARGVQFGVRGEGSGTAKLTEDAVREIRRRSSEDKVSGAQLAREYGISGMTVSHILRRRLWKHVQ